MDDRKNYARSTVATAPSPAATGLSLTVAASHGTRFPTVPFNVTVCPVDEAPTPANAETLRVTARTGDVLTIEREQEDSAPRTIVVGDRIFAGPTDKTFQDIEDAIEAAFASVLTADPSTPSDDTWWMVRTGLPAAMTVALKVRINGVNYTVTSFALSTLLATASESLKVSDAAVLRMFNPIITAMTEGRRLSDSAPVAAMNPYPLLVSGDAMRLAESVSALLV